MNGLAPVTEIVDEIASDWTIVHMYCGPCWDVMPGKFALCGVYLEPETPDMEAGTSDDCVVCIHTNTCPRCGEELEKVL